MSNRSILVHILLIAWLRACLSCNKCLISGSILMYFRQFNSLIIFWSDQSFFSLMLNMEMEFPLDFALEWDQVPWVRASYRSFIISSPICESLKDDSLNLVSIQLLPKKCYFEDIFIFWSHLIILKKFNGFNGFNGLKSLLSMFRHLQEVPGVVELRGLNSRMTFAMV